MAVISEGLLLSPSDNSMLFKVVFQEGALPGEACVTKMLAKWFQSTRLVTRTKESNMCASVRVANPGRPPWRVPQKHRRGAGDAK